MSLNLQKPSKAPRGGSAKPEAQWRALQSELPGLRRWRCSPGAVAKVLPLDSEECSRRPCRRVAQACFAQLRACLEPSPAGPPERCTAAKARRGHALLKAKV